MELKVQRHIGRKIKNKIYYKYVVVLTKEFIDKYELGEKSTIKINDDNKIEVIQEDYSNKFRERKKPRFNEWLSELSKPKGEKNGN